jgi:uncharacterized membrane protein YphA (DoxX/SURF4 family)
MNLYLATKIKLHLPRILLGTIFILSGINGFLKIFEEPEFSAQGQSFISNLKASGLWWLLLKTLEVVGGVLLISRSLGRFGVLLLAPITLSIVLFHAMFSLKGSSLGFLVFALGLFLIFMWRKNLAKLFHVDRHQGRVGH